MGSVALHPEDQMTINCAHRGDSGNAPENTICAFGRAVDVGVDMIEFDVCTTADGYSVVC
ncbi:MAG: glycerophosphodiester phosphodiesterase family protein, partial [Armatimonadota bacterium]